MQLSAVEPEQGVIAKSKYNAKPGRQMPAWRAQQSAKDRVNAHCRGEIHDVLALQLARTPMQFEHQFEGRK